MYNLVFLHSVVNVDLLVFKGYFYILEVVMYLYKYRYITIHLYKYICYYFLISVVIVCIEMRLVVGKIIIFRHPRKQNSVSFQCQVKYWYLSSICNNSITSFKLTFYEVRIVYICLCYQDLE